MGNHLKEETAKKDNFGEKRIGLRPADNKTNQNEDVETSRNVPEKDQEIEEVKQTQELEARVEGLETELAQANARAEEYWNRLVRLQADFENYKKRALREREDFLKFANEQLIMQILPVLDNFERALAMGKENTSGFYEGVEMIFRQLGDLLKAQGLAPVPASGEKFDPARHEAVAWEETNEEDNIILEELRKGYYLKDKVIRPAMVKVARSKQKEVQEGERIDG